MRRNANGQKRNDRKLSSLALARQQWEQEQERLHGCKYVNGICTVHHGTTTAASERVGTEATGLVCTCRAFTHPHDPKLHDTLPGRVPGDTEKQRFEDAAATDWRTPAEREARPGECQRTGERDGTGGRRGLEEARVNARNLWACASALRLLRYGGQPENPDSHSAISFWRKYKGGFENLRGILSHELARTLKISVRTLRRLHVRRERPPRVKIARHVC